MEFWHFAGVNNTVRTGPLKHEEKQDFEFWERNAEFVFDCEMVDGELLYKTDTRLTCYEGEHAEVRSTVFIFTVFCAVPLQQ